ncbi:hypothetical protein ACP4OV_012463 [Aristida adscensionis]
MSKWARASYRLAKVGKGLVQDENAQLLALQHWLEAIDPRHRYGHNLHFYYDCWKNSETKEHFFYWLDLGEGRGINLEDKCPRAKLLSECIKYLGPKEREDYEVAIDAGKFLYKNCGRILDTSSGPQDAKWIFVLSTSKRLYVGQKEKGRFQHSSFLAGGAASAAGRLVVENGTLKAIWPHSGHYCPTEENFEAFKSFLKDNSVDLTDVQMSPIEEEELLGNVKSATDPEKGKSQAAKTVLAERGKCKEMEVAMPGSSEDHAPVPLESILERIKSKKKVRSYQLGDQLQRSWATGAGPRIACVRDYPVEMQLQALEQMQLSTSCSDEATEPLKDA